VPRRFAWTTALTPFAREDAALAAAP